MLTRLLQVSLSTNQKSAFSSERGMLTCVSPVSHRCAVSLENVLCDVKELQRGMELTWREFSVQHNSTLKDFISRHESRLSKLQEDARIAQVTSYTHLITPGQVISYAHLITPGHVDPGYTPVFPLHSFRSGSCSFKFLSFFFKLSQIHHRRIISPPSQQSPALGWVS